MAAVLCLDVPWLDDEPRQIGDLAVVRGREGSLTYDDGISLQVIVLDPAAYASADELVAAAREERRPGRAVLVVGSVPVSWRAALRTSETSFIDVGGVAEIAWPRLRVSEGRFTGQAIVRRRAPVPLQQGHAPVAQELVIAAGSGQQPLITGLARRAEVSVSTASRAVTRFAEHGLVRKRRQQGRQVRVETVDLAALADLLAERTGWPGAEVVSGYVWGRTVWDVAATVSRNATEAGTAAVATGRVGAGFLGMFGTSPPAEARFWVSLDKSSLVETAEALGLEPAPRESANVRLSADPWRIGTSRSGTREFDGLTATVAHPVRVWCDLHGEQRGLDFAAQLWGSISNARGSSTGRRLRRSDEHQAAGDGRRCTQVLRQRIRRQAPGHRGRRGAEPDRGETASGHEPACWHGRPGFSPVAAPASRQASWGCPEVAPAEVGEPVVDVASVELEKALAGVDAALLPAAQ